MKPFHKKIALTLTLLFSFILVNAQDTNYKKSNKMKKVLLIGRLANNIPMENEIVLKNIELFAATNLDDVKKVFDRNSNQIDIVIMGAGIELENRLDIIRYIFIKNDSTTVHLKDRASGPNGFLPFINNVLKAFLGKN